jgi:HK97 gp10 family phage protein
MVVTGDEQLDANLQALAGPGITRASLAAIRAGLRILQRAEKAAAPKGKTGALQRSIGMRMLKRAKGLGGKAGIGVGQKSVGRVVNAGPNFKSSSAPHGHFVALGTRRRWSTSGTIWNKATHRWQRVTGVKLYRGQVKPNIFIRRATASSANSIRFAMRTALAAAIGREVNKMGRKTGQAVGGVV